MFLDGVICTKFSFKGNFLLCFLIMNLLIRADINLGSITKVGADIFVDMRI